MTVLRSILPRGLVVLAVLLSVSGVRAEGSGGSPEYKELIRKALQEYELGNWGEAKVFFSDAHAIFPNARTLRGLALTSYALRDYVQAIDYFEKSLANPVQPLSPQLQAGVKEYLDQARRFVARVKVSVEPRSATLRLDDSPITLPPDGTLQLNPGQHELVAAAPGYDSQTRRWNVEAGARSELSLQLKSQAAALPPPPVAAAPAAAVSSEQAAAPVAEDSGGGGSVAPWVVVGISGALAIGGGVMLAVTASDISSVEDAMKGTPWSEVEGAYERAPAYSAAGFAMIGVGVAGLATGLTWALWPSEPEQRVALDVTPTGMKLHGSF
ncbi:MAG TPA: tetratricopeptide repeat protein [Polyangiales bacterium]|nr:tetratricopeptide repeat protein [Polyangiales bacterium]